MVVKRPLHEYTWLIVPSWLHTKNFCCLCLHTAGLFHFAAPAHSRTFSSCPTRSQLQSDSQQSARPEPVDGVRRGAVPQHWRVLGWIRGHCHGNHYGASRACPNQPPSLALLPFHPRAVNDESCLLVTWTTVSHATLRAWCSSPFLTRVAHARVVVALFAGSWRHVHTSVPLLLHQDGVEAAGARPQ